METYANYDYYKNEYKGQADKPLFEKYSTEATIEIENATHSRATKDIKEVKNCMCKLVDTMIENAKLKSIISSEKVGNHSVTYTNKTQKDISMEYYLIINKYLGRLGLLGGAIAVVN